MRFFLLLLIPSFCFAQANISVDLSKELGPLETYRQSIGHGGVNSRPLPDHVVEGLAKLHPRLIRIFIQEFFNIYPEHGRFDWSRLDPYMDSLQKTGAKVVAAITIKPKPLYPKIDASIWRPSDEKEWQSVIDALVHRYSVEKPIVTYWEIGNETDIGENGGCPWLITNPDDYAAWYAMTIPAILRAFPRAKVGGPGVANAGSDYIARFLDHCRKEKLQLDFISWHLYSSDPASHASLAEKYRRLLEPFGQKRPEMLITEWNKGFDRLSYEELAFDPRRAANAAACMLSMIDARVDWTFYYHAWDQTCYIDEFKPFFANPGIMYHHWNEVPHRFGLFGQNHEVRPQYFVYEMLGKMGDRRLAAESDAPDVRVLASRSGRSIALLLVNFAARQSREHIATIHLKNVSPGVYNLTAYRIDSNRRWSDKSLQLDPIERRQIDAETIFTFQHLSPADSVSLILLTPP